MGATSCRFNSCHPHQVEIRRIANKTANAVLFAFTPVSPFPKSSPILFGSPDRLCLCSGTERQTARTFGFGLFFQQNLLSDTPKMGQKYLIIFITPDGGLKNYKQYCLPCPRFLCKRDCAVSKQLFFSLRVPFTGLLRCASRRKKNRL